MVKPLKQVIRAATESDLKRVRDNAAREKQAFEICNEKIAKHKLKMKLVVISAIKLPQPNDKFICFISLAEGFPSCQKIYPGSCHPPTRELVKDLASVFRTRIELRQIGGRDGQQHFYKLFFHVTYILKVLLHIIILH